MTGKVTGASLQVGSVVKEPRNPLFAEDRPWEVRYDNVYANIFQDPSDNLYKCWYSPFIVDPSVKETPRADRTRVPYKPRKREMGVCYAVSKDGLHWDKPALAWSNSRGRRRTTSCCAGRMARACFAIPTTRSNPPLQDAAPGAHTRGGSTATRRSMNTEAGILILTGAAALRDGTPEHDHHPHRRLRRPHHAPHGRRHRPRTRIRAVHHLVHRPVAVTRRAHRQAGPGFRSVIRPRSGSRC